MLRLYLEQISFTELVDHVAVYSRPLKALGGESALHLNLQFRGGVLGSLP